MTEQFGYNDACTAVEHLQDGMEEIGLDPDSTFDGVILGSGLGGFAETYLTKQEGPVLELSFQDILDDLDVDELEGSVPGHSRSIIIAHLDGAPENALIIAQAGREHPYEGVDTRRATFWIRVMQMLGTRSLIGSNASGIVTPRTLTPPALVSVIGDRDYGNDNPLIGPNDRNLGPRFPHMADLYTAELRSRIAGIAKQKSIPITDGLYLRVPGPHYETAPHLYALRREAEGIWSEAGIQEGETDYSSLTARAVVGMSSTYEARVAQHASQAEGYPAFQDGKAFISVATNYSASRGPEGIVVPSNHAEVQDQAAKVQDDFGQLVHETLLDLQQSRAAAEENL